MSQTGGIPKLSLNLTNITKNQQDNNLDDLPPIPAKDSMDQTQQPARPTRQRPQPVRNTMTLNKKNLVVNNDSDSSDIDDFDIETVPVGDAPEKVEKEPDADTPGPIAQVSQLPDFAEDSDDDEGQGREKNKLSLLYDFLLTQDQCDEPQDEWTYKGFIKDYAKSEAREDNNGDSDDEYDEYGEEEMDDEYD